MDTNDAHDWARAAVARLLKRCAERAVRDLEAQAGELLLLAARLKKAGR